MSSTQDIQYFIGLYRASLIPLHACLVGLTWIIHDYFITLEDEMKYIWSQKPGFGITSDNLCVAMDSIIRVVGAISLWSIEIVMMLRVYALYRCSRRVAYINGILFLGSIAGFLWVLIHNAQRRRAVIADAIHLPLPGCPSIHTGVEWLQWIPATIFEGILFGFALFKTLRSTTSRIMKRTKVSLYSLLLRDNVLYFFGITILLLFNNLMVVQWAS
ncbi:hypothetical protein H0H92_009483 [Tricholoma furcatifolium]|nr:hypothetical protein H0H92_009483 [Tricholoma furcatifolium]